MSGEDRVGQRLKTIRERKGLAYVDVSRATGVYIHHLAALEFGRYDEISDDDVVDSHVHAYAEHLGLDGTAVVAELRRERGLPEKSFTPPAAPGRRAKGRRLPNRWVAAPVLLALIAVAAWWGMRPSPTPPPAPETTPAVAPPVAAPESEPAPEPEPEPAPEPPREVLSSLSVPEHGVGLGVRENRLVSPGDRFQVGTVVWYWTLVVGATPGETVRHVWRKDGRDVQAIDLRLGAARWRTHSSKTLPTGSTGEWSVEVRDRDGNVLARDTFLCVP